MSNCYNILNQKKVIWMGAQNRKVSVFASIIFCKVRQAKNVKKKQFKVKQTSFSKKGHFSSRVFSHSDMGITLKLIYINESSRIDYFSFAIMICAFTHRKNAIFLLAITTTCDIGLGLRSALHSIGLRQCAIPQYSGNKREQEASSEILPEKPVR